MEGFDDENAKIAELARQIKLAGKKKEQGQAKRRPHGRPDRTKVRKKRTGRGRSRS
jgi:hypothetical protein